MKNKPSLEIKIYPYNNICYGLIISLKSDWPTLAILQHFFYNKTEIVKVNENKSF